MPAKTRVDVCLHAFEPDAVAAVPADVLDPEESARLGAFMQPRDRQAYLRSHLLLRRVLAERAGVAPCSLVFGRLPGGKPVIDLPVAARPLAFNLSHTEGLVACAVSTSRDIELGVDVEAVQSRVDALMRSPRVLSARELRALFREPDEHARRRRFFSLWTLKEACVKASGEGLSPDLSGLGFQLTGRRARLAEGGVHGHGHWSFFHTRPTASHQMALAIRSAVLAPVTVRLHWWRDEDLNPFQGEPHGQGHRRQPPRHHPDRGRWPDDGPGQAPGSRRLSDPDTRAP